jgi:hypothetical protein
MVWRTPSAQSFLDMLLEDVEGLPAPGEQPPSWQLWQAAAAPHARAAAASAPCVALLPQNPLLMTRMLWQGGASPVRLLLCGLRQQCSSLWNCPRTRGFSPAPCDQLSAPNLRRGGPKVTWANQRPLRGGPRAIARGSCDQALTGHAATPPRPSASTRPHGPAAHRVHCVVARARNSVAAFSVPPLLLSHSSRRAATPIWTAARVARL